MNITHNSDEDDFLDNPDDMGYDLSQIDPPYCLACGSFNMQAVFRGIWNSDFGDWMIQGEPDYLECMECHQTVKK